MTSLILSSWLILENLSLSKESTRLDRFARPALEIVNRVPIRFAISEKVNQRNQMHMNSYIHTEHVQTHTHTNTRTRTYMCPRDRMRTPCLTVCVVFACMCVFCIRVSLNVCVCCIRVSICMCMYVFYTWMYVYVCVCACACVRMQISANFPTARLWAIRRNRII